MLKEFISKLLKFINKHFLFFLLVVVFISLGQMIFMDVWQDDQALFFKLAHINEPAGFFGDGPFGAGPYRYAATPFIPIYQLFGFNTYAYFTFMLFLYGLATIIVYKTFKLILGEKAGKVAGFLFAAGYITSDGAYRMANSVTTSFSIIFACLIIYSYWKFFKSKKIIWYIFALAFFFASLEFSITRMHYFFVVIVAFEIIFLTWGKPLKSLLFTFLRLTPFFLIFYHYMVLGGDPRVGESSSYFFAFLNNKFYLYYGFFASLTNLIIPDWFLKPIANFLIQSSTSLGYSNISRVLIVSLLAFSLLVVVFLFKRSLKIKVASFILVLIWILFAKSIFNTPFLSLSPFDLFSSYIGGVIIIIYTLSIFYFEKFKKLLIFLGLWLVGNIVTYSAYFPTVAYETTNRYLTHSFIPLVALLGFIFSISIKKKGSIKYISYLIIIFAIFNIYHSFLYQRNILISRSYKTKNFYNQLKIILPEIKKGDVLYFDLASSNQGIYRDAITAAMMPDTTSIAWRYGIDRYDFKLTNDFDKLLDIISEDKKRTSQIHSFWFSGDNLISTSDDMRKYIQGNLFIKNDFQTNPSSVTNLENKASFTLYNQGDIVVDFEDKIKSSFPLVLSLTIKAIPINPENITFPIMASALDEPTKLKISLLNLKEIEQFFEYQEFKNTFYQNVSLKTSSDWQDRILKNLIDQDPTSVWQSDRVLWEDSRAFVEIEFPEVEEINRLVWINGFPNNTPISYSIKSSMDGENWTHIANINKNEKIIDTKPQVVSFKPTTLKYIQMVVTATIGGDSPSISEIWVIPSKLEGIDVEEAEYFLNNPFLYIKNKEHFNTILDLTKRMGKATLFWKNDKVLNFQTNKNAEVHIIYDGIPRVYEVPIPAGGLNLSSIMLSNFTIPGDILISSISTSTK